MAELIGQLLGRLPEWLIIPALLIVVVAIIEIKLAETGDSLTDVWRNTHGKK